MSWYQLTEARGEDETIRTGAGVVVGWIAWLEAEKERLQLAGRTVRIRHVPGGAAALWEYRVGPARKLPRVPLEVHTEAGKAWASG